MNNDRKKVSSGSPYEKSIGFSRAIRVGNRIIVSGTAPIAPDGSSWAVGDAYGQAKRCLEIMQEAINEAGGSMADVVRTRMYLTDAKYEADVGRAHGEYFSDTRPAATMVVVKALVRNEWLVEMEAEAIINDTE
jgi:enamine deaminase RidA (YjgF/YER057c/UK114 family)